MTGPHTYSIVHHMETTTHQPTPNVTVIGPNLPDQSRGSFHVHAAGCLDATRYPFTQQHREFHPDRMSIARDWYWDQVTSDLGLNPDSIEADDAWRIYLPDFHFFPCVDSLPEG